MIATSLLTLASAFAAPQSAAPPACLPQTVVTMPGVPVQLAPSCQGAGTNPTVTITVHPNGGSLPALPGLYTPAAGFRGTDHVNYTVKNNQTGETSDWAAINLVVKSTPVCSDGTATTDFGTSRKLAFPCTNADGSAVYVRIVGVQNGRFDADAGPADSLTYIPKAGFSGQDVIRYVGMDGSGTETGEQRLTITVLPDPSATPVPTATPIATAFPTPVPTAAPVLIPAADTTAPTVTLKTTGKPSVAKGVTVTVKSDEAGTAKLTLAAGKNTASKSAKLVNGTTKVTLKLSAKARKALKAKKTVKATLTAVATDAAGNKRTKKLALTLRR